MRDDGLDWLMKKKEKFLVFISLFMDVTRQAFNTDSTQAGVISRVSFLLHQTTWWLTSWWRRSILSIHDRGFYFGVHSDTWGC